VNSNNNNIEVKTFEPLCIVTYPFTEADDRPHGAAESTAAT